MPIRRSYRRTLWGVAALLTVDLLLLAVLSRLDLTRPGDFWPALLVSGLATAVAVANFLLIWRLLSRLQRLHEQSDRSTMRSRELLDALEAAVVLWDADGRLVVANAEFRDLYREIAIHLQPGLHFEDGLRAALAAGLIPQAEADPDAWIAQRMQHWREPQATLLREMHDGRWRRIVEQRLSDGSLLAHSVDVTELVQAQRELVAARNEAETARQRLSSAIDALPEGLELYDADDRLVLVNHKNLDFYPQLADLASGHVSFAEVLRASYERGSLPQVSNEAEFQAWLQQRHQERRDPREPSLQQLADGRWLRVHESRTAEGGLVGVRTDVTELVRRERQLSELNARLDAANAELAALSETNALTGLPNRRHFDRRLAEECARAARHGMPLTLLMLDVDHFKRYNDRHGHPAGDECLRAVARVLREAARRPNDLVARIGGEEFAILLPHLSESEARHRAERCLAAMAEEAFPHGDSPVAPWVTLSIGGAHFEGPAVALAPQRLLVDADAALYQAKLRGRNQAVMHKSRSDELLMSSGSSGG